MAFGAFTKSGDAAPMAEINMIPLIDVMLVLLVIFIITAPLLTHAVRIDLPSASSRPAAVPPQNIQLAIRADGEILWNGQAVDSNAMSARMAAAARLDPKPEIHLRADRVTEYQRLAEVISAAARAGLVKIAFVTTPTEDQIR
jgi:biopolymer transport protein ExbD